MDQTALVDLHQRLSAYQDFLFDLQRDIEAPEFKAVTVVLQNLEKAVKNIPGPIIVDHREAKVKTFANVEVRAPAATDDSQRAFQNLGEILGKNTPMNMGIILLAKTMTGIIYYVSTFSPQASREIMQEFINKVGGQL